MNVKGNAVKSTDLYFNNQKDALIYISYSDKFYLKLTLDHKDLIKVKNNLISLNLYLD